VLDTQNDVVTSIVKKVTIKDLLNVIKKDQRFKNKALVYMLENSA
jgi:hypothetical protein